MSRRVDTDAFERRVRPIYDALDARNFKNALKLTNAALEKYPGSCLLMGLKAIGLQRSGKEQDANKLCDEIVTAGPTDEASLHPLMIVLKDLHRFSDITLLYEKAVECNPNDVDLLRCLFGAYVREANYAKQQQVAMKLLKLQPNSVSSYQRSGGSYLWWVVLSIILQARASLRGATSSMDPSKLIQLAESMITRQAGKDGKLENFEALLIYIDVLMAQGKSPAALDCVSGNLGAAAAMIEERSHLQAVLGMMQGDLMGASSILEGMLLKNPDDWTSMLLYMDCLLPGSAENVGVIGTASPDCLHPESSLLRLSGSLSRELTTGQKQLAGSSMSPSDAEAARKTVLSLLGKLVDLVEQPPSITEGRPKTMRGPYLAKVELLRRCALIGCASEQDLAETILEYYQQHGHLVSCATDLRVYTSHLGGDATAWLASQMQKEADSLSQSTDPERDQQEQVRALRREVCAHQVLNDLGCPLFSSASEAVSHSTAMMKRFAQSQHLYKGLDSRELGPADELPVLAAGSLVSAASFAGTDSEAVHHMLQAVLLLRGCVEMRPYNAAMRLHLTALYTLMGCPSAAHSQYQFLEVKNIQMDSLASHYILPAHLAVALPSANPAAPTTSSSPQQLKGLLKETMSLFEDHTRDSGETLFKAFKCGSYSKVLEFVAFRERMSKSHTYSLARAETALQAVHGAAAQQDLESVRSAVVQACAALPMSELPASVAAPSASEKGSTCGLRFNVDLSTRPAWYPPNSEACHLAPLFWWEARQKSKGEGYGRRWWSVPNAAESTCQEAASMRARRLAALRRRWLLPHVLGAALAVHESGSHESTDSVSMARAIELLSDSFGADPQAAGALSDMQKLSMGLCSSAPAPVDLELCQFRLFEAAEEVDRMLGNQFSEEQPPSSTSGGRLPVLMNHVSALADGITQCLTRSQLPVPGSYLNAAATFLKEVSQLLLLLLTTWSKCLKSQRKKGGNSAADAAALLSDLSDLSKSLSTCCQNISGSLAAMVGNTAAEATRVQDVLALVQEAGCSGGNSVSSMWDWQQTVTSNGVLQDVLDEQHYVATQLLALSTKQQKAAAALSFA